MKIARRLFFAALVIGALGAAGLMCQRVNARGRYATPLSTYGAGPEGTRGLYLLTERMGARPQRWAEELGRLPEGAMLVALGDCRHPIRREVGRLEREYLRRWIRRGGVLVVAGAVDYANVETIGVELVRDDDVCAPNEWLALLARGEQDEDEEAEGEEEEAPHDDYDSAPDEYEQPDLEDLRDRATDDPVGTYEEVAEEDPLGEARMAMGTGPPFDNMIPVGLRRALEVSVPENARATTLLRLDGPNGQAVGVRVALGRGAVIALASASLLTNRDLRTQGGGVLFARLVREHAPRGPVLFDEYHLGVGQKRSMMRYLRQVGATALIVQVLLLVVFMIWRTAVRFGGTKLEPAPEPAGTASYVDGVATLYASARDPAGAGRIVIRRALSRIAAHHHLGTSDVERMLKLLEDRRRKVAAEAVRALSSRLESDLASVGLAKLVEEVDALAAKAFADSDQP